MRMHALIACDALTAALAGSRPARSAASGDTRAARRRRQRQRRPRAPSRSPISPAIDLRGSDDVDVRVGTGFSVRAEGPRGRARPAARSTRDGDTLRRRPQDRGASFELEQAAPSVKIFVTMPRLAGAERRRIGRHDGRPGRGRRVRRRGIAGSGNLDDRRAAGRRGRHSRSPDRATSHARGRGHAI